MITHEAARKNLDFSGNGRIKVDIKMVLKSEGYKRQLAACKAIRALAAQRTALLALADRIRNEGMQGVANQIEEIVK